MSIKQGTVDITRTFAHPPSTVFAAWSAREAQEGWGDPGEGWRMAFDHFGFAVGEVDICRFGPEGGQEFINENRYLAIDPNERIVYASTLSCDVALTFAGTVAVAFEETVGGTRMRLVEDGLYFDGRDSADGHRAGWQGMLDAMEAWLDARRK